MKNYFKEEVYAKQLLKHTQICERHCKTSLIKTIQQFSKERANVFHLVSSDGAF